MNIPRKTLVNLHLITGSFLLPVTIMFAVTGSLYTFKNTGSYKSTTEVITLVEPLAPELGAATLVAEKILNEKGLAFPSGSPSIKKVGTSWQLEWTGSRVDLVLDATTNPLEMKATFKQTTWHRFFVQLHKAKGGLPFKLLAATLGIGLIGLQLTGWFLAQASPQMRRLRAFANLAGVLAFLGAALSS